MTANLIIKFLIMATLLVTSQLASGTGDPILLGESQPAGRSECTHRHAKHNYSHAMGALGVLNYNSCRYTIKTKTDVTVSI